MSDITSTEKKRRFILFCLIGLLVAGGIVFGSFLLFTPEKPAATAKLTGTKTDAVKGQAGGEGSDEYNRKLAAHDEQKANAALTAGDSFIPTPVGKKAPIVAPRATTPPPSPAVAPVHTAPVQAPRADNSLLKRMMEDLAALDTRLSSVSAGEGKIVYVRDFSRDARETAPVEKAVDTEMPASPPVAGIKPGDLLYAVIDTGVNSDVPSAVMATVASGKYRDARLLGKFQRFEERLVLAFSNVILPSGERLQVEAYAVDPSTSEASVASSVDTHFFSRWGGLVASAFLEGLGTAKRYSGSQSTVYGGINGTSDQMIWNSYSPADQAWIAAGKVGEKAGKIMEKNFERPPTVYLESGTPVGILVLSVKDAK
jgi:type IV secretory pathway VirB10-like protein